MNCEPRDTFGQALIRLREAIPRLVQELNLETGLDTLPWQQTIDAKLLPRLEVDFPLTVAVCGGGSAGKSSLFNALVGAPLSPVGGRAGMNRRVLVAAAEKDPAADERPEALQRAWGCRLARLKNPGELTEPGCPLVVTHPAVPPGLMLLDTPDFDTGARGRYTNRDAAGQALEAADVLVYIFTNSNYNNRDNTDFIARMLTGIGLRRCFLVYRVYSGFDPAEVREHAQTVARNLYGARASEYVLGIYRADESNAVAAGQQALAPRPLETPAPTLLQALSDLDARKLRLELLHSIVADVLQQAEVMLRRATMAREALQVYRNALYTVQRLCIQKALRHFPLQQVMQRFTAIWRASDPTHIKAMRTTGRLLDLPVRACWRAAQKVRRTLNSETLKPSRPAQSGRATDLNVRMQTDLADAAEHLHRWVLDPQPTVSLAFNDPLVRQLQQLAAKAAALASQTPLAPPPPEKPGGSAADSLKLTFSLAPPPALDAVRTRLQQQEWARILDAILARHEQLAVLPADFDLQLATLVQQLRRAMGFGARLRQTFAAILNVLPATAAVTYILSTGDPVGAVGIKVKLAGLFGLHDLYALVALPATSGLKAADQHQLETVLTPLAQTWLNSRLQAVQDLFEKEITGHVLNRARETLDHAAGTIEEGRDSLQKLQAGMTGETLKQL